MSKHYADMTFDEWLQRRYGFPGGTLSRGWYQLTTEMRIETRKRFDRERGGPLPVGGRYRWN